MILILLILPIHTESLSPIRTIQYYDQEPFVLAKFEKNKCHLVNLHMKVSCRSNNSSRELGNMTVNNRKVNSYVKTFFGTSIHFNNENGEITNHIINDEIIIRNSTESEQRLLITKGNVCQDNPISVEVYRMDTKEIKCPRDDIYYDDLSAFAIKMGILTVFLLMLFSDGCCLSLFLRERQRERVNSVNEINHRTTEICDCNK